MDSTIQTDDLLKRLAGESTRQGKHLRTAIRNLTLKALQRRELTLEQIRNVLESVSVGVTLGVADREMKIEKSLADALAGMDDALLKAVEASNVALQKLGAGQDYEDSYLKQALRDLERFEDELLQSMTKAADTAGEKIRTQWAGVLQKKKLSGTGTGAKVAATVRDYAKLTQAEMRAQREAGFRAAHLLTQNFATLASGILIGMSDALEREAAASKRRTKAPKAPKTIKRAPATAAKTRKTTKGAGPKAAKRHGRVGRSTVSKRRKTSKGSK